MERKNVFESDEYYHLYNRGTDKRIIFLDTADYERFCLLLYLSNSTEPFLVRTVLQKYAGISLDQIPLQSIDRGDTIVDIVSWCLMPNHFHLYVMEKDGNGISTFMLKLLTAYSKYYNLKNDRNGRLFQGPFQAKYIDDEAYAEYLLAYIHLNPIKLVTPEWKSNKYKFKDSVNAEAEKFLASYRYSSYPDYLGEKRILASIVNKEAYPSEISTPHSFREYTRDLLKHLSAFNR